MDGYKVNFIASILCFQHTFSYYMQDLCTPLLSPWYSKQAHKLNKKLNYLIK